MTVLGYFLRTPSKYRRQAFFVSSGLLIVILIPVFLAMAPVPANLSMGSIALADAPSSQMDSAAVLPAVTPPVVATVSTVSAPVWPANGYISLEFGAPDWPYMARHTGIDIAGHNGQPVHPFMKGTVTQVLHNGSCGNCVYVSHGNGLVSHYSHLSSVSASVGQIVTSASVIGYEGSTGWSTGPHVHFEIEVNGTPVNPRGYVPGNPTR